MGIDIFGLILLFGAVWYWFNSLKARETAIRRVHQECDAEGVQFLDETVSTAKLSLARNDDGGITLRRVYTFEYSDTGNNRRPGSVTMLGGEVLFVNIGLRLAPSPILHREN